MRTWQILLAGILVCCSGAQAAAQNRRSSIAPDRALDPADAKPDRQRAADAPQLLPRLLLVPPETLAVGERALLTFRTLVTKENYQRMGFASPDQLKTATLGTPMMEAFVGLQALKTFDPQTKAENLLDPTLRVRFPITAGGGTVASITVARVKDQWKPVRYGDSSKSATIDQVLTAKLSATKSDPLSFFEVTVPALGVFFLGHFQGGHLMLTPLRSDSRFGFEQGRTENGRAALTKLVPAAKNHDGQPT